MFIRTGFEGLNISSELQMVLSSQPEYRKEVDPLFSPIFLIKEEGKKRNNWEAIIGCESLF